MPWLSSLQQGPGTSCWSRGRSLVASLVLLSLLPETAATAETSPATGGAQSRPGIEKAVVHKERLMHAIQVHAEELATEVFCALDSDHDGMVSKKEAAHGMARTVGLDADQLYMLWENWVCQGREPQLFHHVVSTAFVAIGRLDWNPCWVSRVTDQASQTAEIGNWSGKHKFVQGLSAFMDASLIFGLERYWFPHKDTDGDGCLSQSEWGRFIGVVQSRYNESNINKYWSPATFSSIVECQLPPEVMNSYQGLQQPLSSDTNSALLTAASSCLDKDTFPLLTQAKFSFEAFAFLNATGTCHEVDQALDGQAPGLGVLEVVLISGIGSILCVGLCAGLWRHRRQRRRLDEAHQVQKLLKAKIDAWATFDSKLRAKTPTLETAFMHILGLQSYGQDVLDLFDIVHTDDVVVLQVLLDQLEADKSKCSLPALAKVRFQYAATGSSLPRREYGVQFLAVELLMSWGSAASILVGISSLGEVIGNMQESYNHLTHQQHMEAARNASHDVDDESRVAGSQHTAGEIILNGSDVISSGDSEAATFHSMFAAHHQGGQVTGPHSKQRIAAIHHGIELAAGKAFERMSSEQAVTPSRASTEEPTCSSEGKTPIQV